MRRRRCGPQPDRSDEGVGQAYLLALPSPEPLVTSVIFGPAFAGQVTSTQCLGSNVNWRSEVKGFHLGLLHIYRALVGRIQARTRERTKASASPTNVEINWTSSIVIGRARSAEPTPFTQTTGNG